MNYCNMEEYVYLNNAATSFPKPPSVVDAVTKILIQPPLHNSRNNLSQSKQAIQQNCRKALATLFNAPSPSDIVFTSSATESLNLALKGSNWTGKHVLTTSLEHNSVLRVLKTMEREQQIRLTIINSNRYGRITLNSIEKHIQPDTVALVLNHCSNVMGTLNDLKTIGRFLKSKHISFVVDAAQSAGLYPIDVQDMFIDILTFTGHKALYGTSGIGGIYIRQNIALAPLKVGGTGAQSDFLYQPTHRPTYYEAGTSNIVGIAALDAGLQFIQTIGLDIIRQKIQKQIQIIKDSFSTYPLIRTYAPLEQPTTILSFTIDGIETADIGYLLEQNYQIIVRTGLHCAPLVNAPINAPKDGTVRVSPSFFTTNAEIEYFIKAIQEILLMTNNH